MAELNTNSQRQNDFIDMMSSEDKWISKSKNALTLLARQFMYNERLSARQFYGRIENWLNNRFGKHKDTVTKKATHRNNFLTEVTQDAMTINTFQKFTAAYGATRVTLKVTMEFNDGRPPVTTEVSFRNNLGEEDESSSNEINQ